MASDHNFLHRDIPFLIDPARDKQWTYTELERDSSISLDGSKSLQFRDWYRYMVELVATLRNGNSVALLPPDLPSQSLQQYEEEATNFLKMHKTQNQVLPLDSKLLTKSSCRLGILTSGTLGLPKLVWHELETLARGIRQSEKHKDDIWGLAYHPTHFAGLQVILQALTNRNPLVVLFGLSADQIHRAIDSSRVTHLSATPTFYRMACTPGAPIHPLVKRVTFGGERASSSLLKILEHVFPNGRVTNLYASTEAGILLASRGEAFCIPLNLKDRIRIRNQELEVHVSLLAQSLKLTDSAKVTIDGFFRTGDRVEWLTPGDTFQIVGRLHEQLNIAGFKVNPSEIEDALGGFPEVAEVKVYGRPNSVTGMLLCIDIRLHAGQTLTVKEVRRRLGESVPAYKIPGLVNFVESIAQTYSGKQAKPQ